MHMLIERGSGRESAELDRLRRRTREHGVNGPLLGGSGRESAELDRLRRRTREHGVNRPLLALVTAILVPFFRVYFVCRA